MDIKKILVMAAMLLIAIIGYNYYSSAQSEKARAARVAETEALKVSNAQARAALKKPEPIVDEGVELEPIVVINNKDIELEPISMPVDSSPPKPIKSNEPSPKEIEKAKSDTCDAISEMSESIMDARLRGVSIQKSLDTLDGINAEQYLKDAFKNVVIQAYKQPDYQTDDMKERATREFALTQYLACTDAFS